MSFNNLQIHDRKTYKKFKIMCAHPKIREEIRKILQLFMLSLCHINFLCIVKVYIVRHREILQNLSVVISLYILVHYILGPFD